MRQSAYQYLMLAKISSFSSNGGVFGSLYGTPMWVSFHNSRRDLHAYTPLRYTASTSLKLPS